MGLDMFLRDLLSSNQVTPSAVQIVEDNAKLCDTSTNSCCVTSVCSSLVEQNTPTVLTRPKPPSRWASCDSRYLMGSRSKVKPTGSQDDMRWTGGNSVQRPSINLRLAKPQRRLSCSRGLGSPLKPSHSDPTVLCQAQESLSKRIEADIHNVSAPQLSFQVDVDDDDFESSELNSLMAFYNSKIASWCKKKKQLKQQQQNKQQKRKQKEQKHQDLKQQQKQKPMLLPTRSASCNIQPPTLPVRVPSIRGI